MRTRLLAVAAAAVSLAVRPAAVADTPPPKPGPAAAEKPAPADWKDDPVCRMVFFAVLEGLYTDGVPDSVVDSIVLRQPKDGTNPVKSSFVIQCPLCHPVYEAFATYQKRPAFNDDAKRSTFGKGIKPELETKLLDRNNMTRLMALAELIGPWIERKLIAMRLTPDELKDWQVKLATRSNEGKRELIKLLGSDPNYKGWTTYWGCAACNGTTAACRQAKASPAAKP